MPGSWSNLGSPQAGNTYLATGLSSTVKTWFDVIPTDSNGDTVTSAAASFFAPSLSISQGTVLVSAQTTVTVSLNQLTNWTPGTPGSPTFTVLGTGMSIVSQTVTNSNTATIVISAGSMVGTAQIHDPLNNLNVLFFVSQRLPVASRTMVSRTHVTRGAPVH